MINTTAEKTAPPNQPILETERLILRPFVPSDAANIQRLAGDFAVADTTLNIPHPYPDGAAEDFISKRAADFKAGRGVVFAITRKGDGDLIGAVGLDVTKRFHRAELGYWIARAHWNCGYATEACRVVLDFGFRHWSLHKIVGTHLSRNPASGRVMKKLGMVQEGLLREHYIKWDRYEDVFVCAIIRASPN